MRTRRNETHYDPHCRACPRLARHLDAVRAEHPSYHCRPVAPFGPASARLLVVGLAPGRHGANASGRPFTGDYAGLVLYPTLHAHGFADRAESTGAGDGLTLRDCRITNAVKCLPPENRPTGAEVGRCNGFLAAELASVPGGGVVLALGTIAHRAVLAAQGLKPARHPFVHGACHGLAGGRRLLDSYHCSRYNVNTRRLTPAMFDTVVATARRLLDEAA